ncbi:MAG: hypothetical protein ACRD5I_05910 [Candidatus Acidiferrales bacterium]
MVPKGAEYLVMSWLMCRNIQVRKAKPGNRGYDLICVHPNRSKSKALRIQVKSRSQEENDGSVPLSERTIGGFDYLVAVFLNITKKQPIARPELYTVSQQWVRKHHQQYRSGGGKLFLKKKGMKDEMEPFKDGRGLEQIARELRVPRPALY